MAFKKQLHTQILMAASPAQVWHILTNTAAYPDWNPFITQLTGTLTVGQTLTVHLPTMRFKPTVTRFQKARELRWLGHLLVKGLFDGEHVFRLEEQANGHTLLHHEEFFSGLLVPLFARQLDQQTKAGFDAMNQALKKRVEDSLSIR